MKSRLTKFSQSRTAAFAVSIVLFLLYLFSMSLGITLEDAGLFQMVCHLGGLSHPPGYPLFTTFCQSFVSIPIAKVIAGNLVSILFALCALLVLYEIVLFNTGCARSSVSDDSLRHKPHILVSSDLHRSLQPGSVSIFTQFPVIT